MNALHRFISLYLSPIEAYALFSRSFAGERFLAEPDIDNDMSIFVSMSKELQMGYTNRFFWKQLLGYLPFAHEDISRIMQDFGLEPLGAPKEPVVHGSTKYVLLREALLAGDTVHGIRNGRFQLESEQLSTMGFTFFQGFDLLHGKACIVAFSCFESNYEQFEHLLEVAQLPNQNLVPILDFGKKDSQFYIVLSAQEPIVPIDEEDQWIDVMKAIFYAYDSLRSRDLSLGALSRFSLYQNQRGMIQVFASGASLEDMNSFSCMSMVGQEIWKGHSHRVSFVISKLSKFEEGDLEDLLDLFDMDMDFVQEERGQLVIDAPTELTIYSWFSKGHKSIRIKNVGSGPLALLIRSNHPALKVLQEHPHPHRLEQLIDLEFDPALLSDDFGEAMLEFETDIGVETRKVNLRKAFWLWPSLITIVVIFVVLWIFL
ncbi:MAG: hypothetical protein CL916_10185 [Deltaproteobacteria bacterium]|nr:hypothetical protein [Deltaproteobacteria bacterium]